MAGVFSNFKVLLDKVVMYQFNSVAEIRQWFLFFADASKNFVLLSLPLHMYIHILYLLTEFSAAIKNRFTGKSGSLVFVPSLQTALTDNFAKLYKLYNLWKSRMGFICERFLLQ